MKISDKLKQRDEEIWQKYPQPINEEDLTAVCRCAKFLGLYEQLVRILRRNTENISPDIKNTDFFKLALITYVDLYCRIFVRPEFEESETDIATIAISEYYNRDYELIATLPQTPLIPDKTELGSWARYMRYQLAFYGIRNLALLEVINMYYFNQTGELCFFQPAKEYKVRFGD